MTAVMHTTCDHCLKTVMGDTPGWKEIYVFDGYPSSIYSNVKQILKLNVCEHCNSNEISVETSKKSVRGFFRKKK